MRVDGVLTMCGIVGFKASGGYNRLKADLPAAAACMHHRGPDDSGFFFEESTGVGLGHRRLAIIDLTSGARQPMTSDDGKVQIVYNGEIYNFIEIKNVLMAKGHQFHTRSDTEVILKAYLEWGMPCLQRFAGMFALAIWDGRNRRLYLARDRMGKKPLYYHFDGGALIFASELKAIVAFKSVSLEIDPDAIPLFLHYQYIPAPGTIYKKTSKLLPGHFLTYESETIKIESYWTLPDRQDKDEAAFTDEEAAVDQLDSLLSQSVADRLISDVPLGALLSGGIDSSTVVALMQKISGSPVRTFSIGFQEKGYNEADWAARVARHLGTDHTEWYVTSREALDVIPALPEIYDEPFADASAIPTYLVCKLARSQVTVALTGDGGDEQFCGYTRYWSTRAVASVFQHLPDPLIKTAARLLRALPPQWLEKCYLPFREFLPQRFQFANFADKLQKLTMLLERMSISELYRLTICLWTRSEIYELLGRNVSEGQYEQTVMATESWPILSRLMRIDQKTYLPDAMLVKVDRASMASSLEVRVPLLDHRVVEFSSSLPETLKYRNGTGKYLLKQLLSRYVPRHLYERPKMGFGLPIEQWLRADLKNLMLDYLSTETLKKEGIFNVRLVEFKIQEHLSGKANHQYRLWALLMWEMWRRRWST